MRGTCFAVELSSHAGSSPRVRHLAPLGRPSSGSSPRVRGTFHAHGDLGYHYGSSPRVRGTLLSALRGTFLCARFIPACAGNIAVFADHGQIAVHPRVCGEHSTVHPPCAASRSGPVHPRVRGTSEPRRNGPVHPRVCGEHDFAASRFSPRVHGRGSSGRFIPRVRGTERGTRPIGSSPREHVPVSMSGLLLPGSSPRVRGTYLIVTACYSLDYMPCKIATDDLTPDSPTPHMPRTYFTQAKKIRVEDRQNPQVSGGLCQRFQTQIPRHWGRPKQSQHHRRR